jgi:hypothetical protein
MHMKSYIAHKKITTLAHKLNWNQVLIYPTLYCMETDSNSGYKKQGVTDLPPLKESHLEIR